MTITVVLKVYIGDCMTILQEVKYYMDNHIFTRKGKLR